MDIEDTIDHFQMTPPETYRSVSHRIHGIGIFAYMNVDFYGKCRQIIPHKHQLLQIGTLQMVS